MRRFFRNGSGPLLLLSLVSVLAMSSYMLLRARCRITQKAVQREAPESEADTVSADTPSDQAEETGGCTSDIELPAIVSNSESREPQPPRSGTIFMKPEAACVAPLTVAVKDSSNYYIYLKFMNPPENADSNHLSGPVDTHSGDLGFYVAANSSVTLNVPAGIYSLTYASGDDWHGLDQKFGPDTKYYKANETLAFYTEKNYLYGNSIQLFPQSDSDSSYQQIESSEFPG